MVVASSAAKWNATRPTSAARPQHAQEVSPQEGYLPGRSWKDGGIGLLERGGKVRATAYWGLDKEYCHQVINHMEAYVRGNVHTNGIENFWSLLKRGLGGTYIAVEPFHLFRYVDEQVFRYNNREHADGDVVKDDERFSRLCSQIVGKRLTYAALTDEERKKRVDE